MNRSEQLAAALLRWSTFPADQQPRPTVLTGDPVQLQGFKSGDAKTAFMTGNIRADVPLPPGVLDRLLVRDQADQGSPLVITRAGPTFTQFSTDRGDRTFPAWQLTIPGALAPITVLDPAIESWWPPNERFYATYEAPCDVTADGLTLTYRFSGSPSRYYRISGAAAVETDKAIIVDVAMEYVGSTDEIIPLYAELRTATVNLGKPLGARVLINAAGGPVTVVSNKKG